MLICILAHITYREREKMETLIIMVEGSINKIYTLQMIELYFMVMGVPEMVVMVISRDREFYWVGLWNFNLRLLPPLHTMLSTKI